MENTKELKSAQEFYDFFEAIDEQFWTQDVLRKRRKLKDMGWFDCGCANYHLGVRDIRTKELREKAVDEEGGYGVFNQIDLDNVKRLAEILDNKNLDDFRYFGYMTTTILSVNDSLDKANEILGLPEDYSLLDIKPMQQAKLAKANMLNALKQIIEND